MDFIRSSDVPALTVFIQGLVSFFLPLRPAPHTRYTSGIFPAEPAMRGEDGRMHYERSKVMLHTLCFVIGLVGFIFSGNSLLLWGMSAAVFTVGEIIYAPGEYMLIDHIAPPEMKASYFSAQSLGWLGAAINPLVSGVVLTSLPPSSLFVILALVIIAAWVLMLKGIRARPWGQPALC